MREGAATEGVLHQCQGKHGHIALHAAAARGRDSVVNVLLEEVANIKAMDSMEDSHSLGNLN